MISRHIFLFVLTFSFAYNFAEELLDRCSRFEGSYGSLVECPQAKFCCALILNLLLTCLFQKRVHFNAIKKDDAILGPIRYLFCCKNQITIFILMIDKTTKTTKLIHSRIWLRNDGVSLSAEEADSRKNISLVSCLISTNATGPFWEDEGA